MRHRFAAAGAILLASIACADQPGDPLPAEALGAGVVEGWEIVLGRDAAMPPEWDANPKDREDARGQWSIPGINAAGAAHSGTRYATNKWGDVSMGIGFAAPTDVLEVHVFGQAAAGVWPPALRVVGFRGGAEVATTAWIAPIDATPRRVAIGFRGVDRIVFEAKPARRGAAWFAIDDLVLVRRGADAAPERLVIDFEDRAFGERLTGSGWLGLDWEEGTGAFEDEGVHAPMVPEKEDDDAVAAAPEAPAAPAGGAGATLPTLGFDFEGVIRGDAGQWSYPPDTCGAAGPDHFVVAVNRVLAVFDKSSGAKVSEASLGSFLPGSSGDPRIVFDATSQRWVVIASNFSNRIYLAVSTSSNPTGSWFKTSVNVSTGADSGRWPDYPTLGTDADGIYVAAYMVGSPASMSIFAFRKAPLVAPSPSLGTVTAFRGLPWEGAMQPAHDAHGGDRAWIISRDGPSRLHLREVTGPLTNPSLTDPVGVDVVAAGDPPNVPALGSVTPLSSVGPRLMNAVHRDGSIWTAHTVEEDGRAACRWYEIDAESATVLQWGAVADPERHYFFPSIAVNALGHVAMGFSGAKADEYAGAWYTGRRANDTWGMMAAPALLRAGQAGQELIDSYGRNRFGDYSLTTADPSDGAALWTIQEYVHDDDVWGTHVGHLEIESGPGNDYCVGTASALVGSTPFDTTGAATNGPTESCLGGAVESDVWFKFIAPCAGTVTLRVCDAAFTPRIAVYTDCPIDADTAIACGTGDCATGETTFTASMNQFFRLRLGSTDGATGTATLVIECTPGPTCPADVDDDGQVGFGDVLGVLAAWGPCPGCPQDADGDGTVGFSDLLLVLSAWGPCS